MDHILIPKITNVLLYKNALFDKVFSNEVNIYITATHLIISEVSQSNELWLLHTLIDNVEMLPLDIKGCPLLIRCKNFQNIILVIQKDGERYDFYQTLINLSKPNFIEDLPLFHHAKENPYEIRYEFSIENEYERMKIKDSFWTKCFLNNNYQICETYPELLYVPLNSQAQTILGSAKFRSKGRFPVLTYLDKTGAALCRSSQPLSGLNARSMEDENYMTDILFANPRFDKSSRSNFSFGADSPDLDDLAKSSLNLSSIVNNQHIEGPNPFNNNSINSNLTHIESLALSNKSDTATSNLNSILSSINNFTDTSTTFSSIKQPGKVTQFQLQSTQLYPYMYIVDTRPKINAMANRAKGAGGYENPSFYTNVKFQFCGVENIHVMRNSLNKLITVCQSKWDNMSTYLNALQSCGWLKHIKAILASAVLVAQLIREERVNVLVHCSDGWDRTAQTVSLTQILLDPYYRTFKGYMTLIEKDWLAYGHKFSDRCGHLNGDKKEVSPVFLQFLDCTWQLTELFPTAFEFNHKFLLELLEKVYSCDTSTFLGNNDKWRRYVLEPIKTEKIKQTDPGVWNKILDPERLKYLRNPFYKSVPENEARDDKDSTLFLKPNLCSQNIKLWLQAYARHDPSLHPKIDMTEILIDKQIQVDALERELAQLQMLYQNLGDKDTADTTFPNLKNNIEKVKKHDDGSTALLTTLKPEICNLNTDDYVEIAPENYTSHILSQDPNYDPLMNNYNDTL